jgi:uncharacterized protein (TIGR02271 family)
MNSTGTGTVAAYFSSETQAEDAVRGLKAAGFSNNQIGLALASDRGMSGAASVGTTSGSSTTTGTTTGARARGAASNVGAKAESAWERFKEFFTGGDGDIEPYADERDRGSTMSHEITGSRTTGDRRDEYQYGYEDVTGSLTGLNVPESRANYFSHKLRGARNGAIVTVNASGREAEAEQILTSRGGDIGANARDYAAADYGTGQTGTMSETMNDQQQIQLLGEVLRVHKERISRGEVRIRKEVVSEQQTVQVPVTREEIVIERVPGGQAAPTQDEVGSSQEVRVPLSEERASLDKQTVVREQVNVGKRAVEGVENLEDTVRREELDVADSTTTDKPRRR